MSPLHDPPQKPDDGRFDRLVDGELCEAERRQLLSSLDDVPDGWRRCALAFLEAQSWKDGLGSIRPAPAARSAQVRPAGRSQFPGGLLGTLVAMAACFVLALGLGMVLHGGWPPGPGPGGRPDVPLLASQEVPAEPGPPSVPQNPPGGWELVTVPVGLGPDGTASIPLPACPADRIDDEWLDRFAPKVPDDLVRLMEQSGHEVRRSRRLVPFRLDDGRRVVVPFEEVEFRPAGRAAYQ